MTRRWHVDDTIIHVDEYANMSMSFSFNEKYFNQHVD